MPIFKDKKEELSPKPLNPRDLYYECITSCSLNDEGIECLTECVTDYYEEVVEK
tara:strand:- start:380 stop:541 length:162 start_codon:yes stop_codon:yes gene_type:complete